MAGYVVRSPVKWGSSDGSTVLLQPGEPLPGDVSEEERLQLLAAGSIVPADTFKALEDQDDKRKKLEERRQKLDAESAALATEEYELQDEAERKLAEAAAPKEAPEPERSAAVTKPAQREEPKADEKSKTEDKAEQRKSFK